MSIKLSIIVPIYNVERYLAECLESLLLQSIEGLEIVCVNDGSTDSSLQIVEEFMNRDRRIVLIDKENSGYGDSVNCGIRASKGEYIGIVESDDIAVENAFEILLEKAVLSEADVVKGNYYLYTSKNDDIVLFENLKDVPYNRVINSNECERLFFVGPSIWSGIYRKDFLFNNEISFLDTPGASYQDTSFAFKVWACAQKVLLIPDPVIYYRQDNSESSSNNSKKVFDIFKETNEMSDFLVRKKLERFMPQCMLAKFRGLKWSMDRLQGTDKIRFLTKMYIDAIRDCINGYLKREYWNWYDWMIINNIIFNLHDFSKLLAGGCESKFANEVIYNVLKTINPVYVFGTGKYGESLYDELDSVGIHVDGFIVKNQNEVVESASKVPFVNIKSVNVESLILINSVDIFKNELLDILDNYGLNNYIEMEM